VTRTQAANLIALAPIVKAFAEGREVQVKNSDGIWITLEDINFWLDPSNYRIKPEPREIWVNFYEDGRYSAHLTQNEADSFPLNRPRIACVRFREVIE